MDDELDAARRRFPVGASVTGRVVLVPRPGAIGLFVGLGEPPVGFVDVLLLPPEAADWPEVGTVARFEVIQHRRGQVRLWPIGEGIPPPGRFPWQVADQEWATRKERHPVGSQVTATVADVYPGNREYVVRFGADNGFVEWQGGEPTPVVGSRHRYRVVRHLDSIQSIRLAPTGPG